MYLTPAAPLLSAQSRTQVHLQGRLLLARHNAIQARRTLTALGYMGVSAPFVRPRRRRLTAMGCSECRTGLSWLGQDDDSGIDISQAPIATDADLTPPPEAPTLTNPMQPVQDILAIGAAAGLNTPTGLPLSTQLQPPSAPMLTNTPGQPLPQAQLKSASLISGVPNTYLYIAGGAVILLGLLAGRR